MKNISLLIIVIILSTSLYGQPKQDRGHVGLMRERLEQFEKVRLLEILNLDEERAVKFITRRSNHRDMMQSIMEKRRKLIEYLQLKISDESLTEDEIKNLTDKILNIDKELANERNKFITSLSTLLTPREIAKVVTFEDMFRQDVKGMIEGKQRKGNPR